MRRKVVCQIVLLSVCLSIYPIKDCSFPRRRFTLRYHLVSSGVLSAFPACVKYFSQSYHLMLYLVTSKFVFEQILTDIYSTHVFARVSLLVLGHFEMSLFNSLGNYLHFLKLKDLLALSYSVSRIWISLTWLNLLMVVWF